MAVDRLIETRQGNGAGIDRNPAQGQAHQQNRRNWKRVGGCWLASKFVGQQKQRPEEGIPEGGLARAHCTIYAPLRPPFSKPYNIKYWFWQYRVEAKRYSGPFHPCGIPLTYILRGIPAFTPAISPPPAPRYRRIQNSTRGGVRIISR